MKKQKTKKKQSFVVVSLIMIAAALSAGRLITQIHVKVNFLEQLPFVSQSLL